jgi:hypothetical protein
MMKITFEETLRRVRTRVTGKMILCGTTPKSEASSGVFVAYRPRQKRAKGLDDDFRRIKPSLIKLVFIRITCC